LASISSVLQRKLFILQRIGKKALYRILHRFNERLQPVEIYCIKKGYHHAKISIQFDDTWNADQWQKKVYELSVAIMQRNAYRSVIDVGCGSAYKLITLFSDYETIGIEISPFYEWLLEKYPDRKWLLFDAVTAGLKADLVICSDVIEHTAQPDEFMEFLNTLQFNELILSTPERNIVAGYDDYGPPENPSHLREWNTDEFKQYVSRFFEIKEHHILPDKSVTQVVICRKNYV
jgi:SAM-dependent methyltransferase